MRDPQERIDELLKANEDYCDRAIKAEARAKQEAERSAFWQSQCERHAQDKALALEEVYRLRLKLTELASPRLFDP
jgi:hypothetical protein